MTAQGSARRLLGKGRNRLSAKLREDSLDGYWDFPVTDGIYPEGDVLFAGWSATSHEAGPSRVQIIRDASVIASFETPADGAGSAEFTNEDRVGGRWSTILTLTAADRGATIEVVTSDRNGRRVLGTRRVQGRPQPTLPLLRTEGALDYPMDGSTFSAGGVIHVSGWILIAGRPADRIELFLGDEPPLLVRRGEGRADLAEAIGETEPYAIGAGFAELVAIPRHWAGTEVTAQVRATSATGSTWISPPASLRIIEAPPAIGRLQPSPLLSSLPARPDVPRETGTPIKVCVFTHSLNLGGGELYLQELLLRMAEAPDVELLVVSPNDGPLRQELEDAGITVHLAFQQGPSPAHYLGRVTELVYLLRAWNTEVVIANTLGVFQMVEAALLAGLPVFWAIHESFTLEVFSYLNFGEHGIHPAITEHWHRSLTQAKTIFEAEATLKMYAEQVPDLDGRCVRYGIDLQRIADYRGANDRDEIRTSLGFERKHRVLLCMGVFQERKSQLALVMAYAEIAQVFPDARLVLVGDHPTEYAACVRQIVAALGLDEFIRIIPIQPETYPWYQAADILVSASDVESLPRSVLESMAFGLPTLAVDVFGLNEVIRDGENGWLCQPRSGTSLLAGLRRALGVSPQKLAAIRAQCEHDAKSFDGQGYADEYLRMIRSCRKPVEFV
ncbi:glycosyltransferase involved in cell wall bisynthesis [Jatrophihabitans sp. GAS493]|uniref:glycosyltransferase family 4 protein n=1 Tax=Jatrophihabitans sp. GAS493 TaxID=1907575 RepID=UPI000BBF6C79|nr:glycosyltransferase family 4 protein [Jatrophihabitans sp. GAS493]SOD71853.1 glycosyltransferase involved in cell wall bisynthesis [Jatrophihabitans sp. GAS493]